MSSGSSARTKRDAGHGENGLVRYSLDELKARRAQGRTRSAPEAPEINTDDDAFWARATVRMPPGKTSIHLRLDSDVLDWFKAQGAGRRAQGAGHLTRMNAVLRAYVDSQSKGKR